ncbi:MAG: isochorismate synthase [Gemmatimonadales bacterium]|nr:MAG: isochorismate synthase [Gemmatimonadales bacterium]
MRPLETPVQPGLRLRLRRRSAPTGDAVRFLRALAGEPRGFWGRGDHWEAWGGVAARIELSGPGGSPERFAQIRERARSLAAPEGSRWFGGFSFLDTNPGPRPLADDRWEAFPSASFILPRVVLRSGSSGFTLTECVHEGEAEGRLEGLLRLLRAKGGDGVRVMPGLAPPSLSGIQVTDPDALARWRRAVTRVLTEAASGGVQKAVMARILDVRMPGAVDSLRALELLRSENGQAHVFYVEPRPGRILLGAAPEVLTRIRDGWFEATAVAGSVARGTTPAEDEARARELLASEKDRMEHRLTVDEMREVLAPRLRGLSVDSGPRVLRLARIQHLETVLKGRVPEGEDVLSLVEALHPTPAVCGRPRSRALELIREVEPFDRGWYAGPVGWFDGRGEGDFVPALRSAVGGGRTWRLFAGAGIVPGSDAEAEWAETALKFEPALVALDAGVRRG